MNVLILACSLFLKYCGGFWREKGCPCKIFESEYVVITVSAASVMRVTSCLCSA